MSAACSSAQALLLGCLEEHTARDEPVYVYGSPKASRVSVFALAEEHGALHSAIVPASLPAVRLATVEACGRRGWIADGGIDEYETQRLGSCWFLTPRTVRLRRLLATEKGWAALDAYRRRPLEPQPELGGVERQIVALAAQAEMLGYALVPLTEEAKRGARALARTPFARRGWGGGASTRSLRATATGEVEVVR